jgi:hypothetical protein
MPQVANLFRRGALAALVTAWIAGCAGPGQVKGPTYLTSTGFYKLPYFMEKARFIKQWEGAHAGEIGCAPVVYTSYPGIDVWEVLIYEVYDHGDPLRTPAPRPDHREYVLFRNGQLQAWGQGTLTLTPYDVLVERKVVSGK